MQVAFLGLGAMGHGMARQILDKGHGLRVYNRTRARGEDLERDGARGAASPREAADGAEVVITMVSNDQALRQVAEGADGFLAGLAAGATVLQMSTIGPDTTAWLAGEAATRGAGMLDCPVLGSRPEADKGQLWILAAGDAALIDRMEPLLTCMGQQVYRVGQIGQATRLKLCNNLIVGGVVAALAEGMALVQATGVDPQLYLRVLQDARLPERLMLGKAGLMASGDFEPRFSLENMAKDLGLALALGRSYNLDLMQTAASRETMLRGAAVAGGNRDMAAAVKGISPVN